MDQAVRKEWGGNVIMGVVMMILLAILAQTFWTIQQDRQVTIDSENEHALIAARLLEEHATQTLRDADGSLLAVINTLREIGQNQDLNETTIRNVLRRAHTNNRILKALQYVNTKGQAFVSTLDYPAYQVDADERTYIPYMLKHPEIENVVIGRAFQRFYDSEFVVPIARNLFTEDGQFLGIISTDISVSYFSNVYSRIAKNSKAMVSLFTDEGMVIVRFPFEKQQLGKVLSGARASQLISQMKVEGKFIDENFLDVPNHHLYAYKKAGDFPVIAVFARDLDSILNAWRIRTQDRIIVAALTIGFVIIFSVILWLQIKRLRQSEISLLRSQSSLQASKEKFTSLFKFSPIPLALIDFHTSKFLEINDALSRQTGFQTDEMLGKTPFELNIWENYEHRKDYLNLLRTQGFVEQFEMRFRNKDGKIGTCLLSSRVIESEGNKLVIYTPIDITQIRTIEREIRLLNFDLEERVRQRTLRLEETNIELANALENVTTMQGELIRSEKMAALGSLVAGIAHELNTPIGNSVTVASTIEEHMTRLGEEMSQAHPKRSVLNTLIQETQHGAQILVRSLDRAAQLIFSFKQVAVDQSSNHRRQFDLVTTIKEILTTLEPMHRRSGHQLHVNIQAGIKMDSYPGPLSQIITNFLNNALGHAFEEQQSGNIWISAHAIGSEQVEICFKDDGVGIPEEHLGKVFDPFFTTKLGKGGSGLGMHIVYNLVTDVLGGKIHLESKEGVGTKITLNLPLVAPVKQSDKALDTLNSPTFTG